MACSALPSAAFGQGPGPQGPIPNIPPTWPLSPYSTHDWTSQTDSALLAEVWVDTKTPGDGRTYSVGTVLATNVDSRAGSLNLPTFSGVSILSPTTLAPASYTTQGAKAVVVLQCATPPSALFPEGIVWQRFFFGNPPNFGGTQNNFVGMSCHARAVSVFPGTTPTSTRIAICGETYDQSLPGDNFQRTNYGATGGIVGGFLAVYDGDGNVLWSQLYSGSDPLNATTITDVSIRTESVSTSSGTVLRDVVTFCGMTQCGYYYNPGISTPGRILAHNAFLPPPAHPQGHATVAGGATHNGLSQTSQSSEWDGLIGRVWQNQTGYSSGSGTDFFCLVGGAFQDGLFGIAELNADRFVVVGSTAKLRGGSGTAEFPLTKWSTFNDTPTTPPFNSFNQPWFQFGTLLEFDATATRSNGNLLLLRSELLGSKGHSSVARDVLAQGDNIFVVGSTDDPNFCTPFQMGSTQQIDGPIDGFLIATHALHAIAAATYVTGSDSGYTDELVGVAGWNEFEDHVVVMGRQRTSTGSEDVFAAKLFLDTTAGTYTAGAPTDLELLRTLVLPGTGKEVIAEIPTNLFSGQAHGWSSGTGIGGPFEFGPTQSTPLLAIGSPYGGGGGVGKNGRATLVGGTFGIDYRVEGGGRNVSAWAAIQTNVDAVRTELDLLPTGVCRTDGTSGFFPPVYAPTSGDGGTTPVAALTPFGNQIGSPTPAVQRMLIDFEGDCSSGAAAAILIGRPPAPSSSTAYASFLQLGVPGPSPASIPSVMPGVEVWTTSSPVTATYLPHEGTLRIPLWSGSLPVGSYAFTLQFFAGLTGPVPFVASPALIFAY